MLRAPVAQPIDSPLVVNGEDVDAREWGQGVRRCEHWFAHTADDASHVTFYPHSLLSHTSLEKWSECR